MNSRQSLRVLHAPLNVANDPWARSRGEREVGLVSDLALLAPAPGGPIPEHDLSFRDCSAAGRFAGKYAFVRDALHKYDVFHFDFGTSILDYRRAGLILPDLRWAARRGKTVAMTFHGCDVRMLTAEGCSFCQAGCDRTSVARRVDTIRKHADLLYVTTPDLIEAVRDATYRPAAVVLPDEVPFTQGADRPFRVVHAPSDPALKGTDAVIRACDELKSDGLDVELVLVTGVDHAAALELYASADVAVDQLLVGWYGVFAVEMMAIGRPVIARIDDRYASASNLSGLPIINADALTLRDTLADLYRRRAELPGIGTESRTWAAAHHGHTAIGRALADDYARTVRARR